MARPLLTTTPHAPPLPDANDQSCQHSESSCESRRKRPEPLDKQNWGRIRRRGFALRIANSMHDARANKMVFDEPRDMESTATNAVDP